MDINLTLVLAINRDNLIGLDNSLPWYCKGDLAHFKRITNGHPLIMGRNTYESILSANGGRWLKNREAFVVCSKPITPATACQQYVHQGSLDLMIKESFEYARELKLHTVYCIGGATLVESLSAMGLFTHAVISQIHHGNADTTGKRAVYYHELADETKWVLRAVQRVPIPEFNMGFHIKYYDFVKRVNA